jgi:outer membrane protein OmpA-like peptidoglycan-associated protein
MMAPVWMLALSRWGLVMRSKFYAFALVTLVGCAKPKGEEVCYPVSSWHAPKVRCEAVGTAGAVGDATGDTGTGVAETTRLEADQILTREKVQFEVDSAVLLPEGKAVLDEVAVILTEHPELAKVRIDGNADSTATQEYNQELSEQRADSVRDYLVTKGIATERLVTRGFGENRPVANNATDAGREKNRRVEFRILERTP